MYKLTIDLQHAGVLRSPRITKAFQKIDRRLFVPKDLQSLAMEDRPLPIGVNATISAPHMHASVAEHLENALKPGDTVLDVGCGSGFLSCLFSDLVENGLVIGIDIDPTLVRMSISNSSKIQRMRVKMIDGRLIYMQNDAKDKQLFGQDLLFDAIHVGAMCKTIPENLVKSLKVPGCMIVPVNGMLKKVSRISSIQYTEDDLSFVSFVPLK